MRFPILITIISKDGIMTVIIYSIDHNRPVTLHSKSAIKQLFQIETHPITFHTGANRAEGTIILCLCERSPYITILDFTL